MVVYVGPSGLVPGISDLTLKCFIGACKKGLVMGAEIVTNTILGASLLLV